MAKQLSILLAVFLAFAPVLVSAQERGIVITVKGVAPQTPVYLKLTVSEPGHGNLTYSQIKVGPGDVRFSKVSFLRYDARVDVIADAHLGETQCRRVAGVKPDLYRPRPVTVDFSGCQYFKKQS